MGTRRAIYKVSRTKLLNVLYCSKSPRRSKYAVLVDPVAAFGRLRLRVLSHREVQNGVMACEPTIVEQLSTRSIGVLPRAFGGNQIRSLGHPMSADSVASHDRKLRDSCQRLLVLLSAPETPSHLVVIVLLAPVKLPIGRTTIPTNGLVTVFAIITPPKESKLRVTDGAVRM
jgi:hypothetical protein